MKTEAEVRQHVRLVSLLSEGCQRLTGVVPEPLRVRDVTLRWVLGEVPDPPDSHNIAELEAMLAALDPQWK